MESIGDLIRSIRSRQLSIWAEAGHIRIEGRVELLNPDELATLRAFKPEILDHLERSQLPADVPLPHRSPAGTIGLTATQMRPWNYTAKPRTRARTEPFVCRIRGQFDTQVMTDAIDAVANKHEALRIKLVESDEGPRQWLRSDAANLTEVVDLSSIVDARAQEGAARACLAEFLHYKIDPRVDPLFAARIIRLSAQEHLLAVSVDHIVTDGMSNEILRNDLWQHYRTVLRGERLPLIDSQPQFLSHAEWLERTYCYWLRSGGEYWKRRMEGAQALQWPDECPAERISSRFCTYALQIDAASWTKLINLARSQRILPATIVLTAYCATVMQWCRQPEVIVAAVDSGRHRAELATMVGCLANHLHLRIRSSSGASLLDLLQIVADEHSSAARNCDFDRLAALLPDFQADVCFNWLHRPHPSEAPAELPGMNIEALACGLDSETVEDVESSFDFKVNLVCFPDDRNARLWLSTRHFSETSAAAFGQLLRANLEAVCENASGTPALCARG